MDALVVALVSGLLGGGVAGAIIGGLITLRSQRQAFDHERRTRFLDLKRDRYAGFLVMTEEWFRAQWQQMDIAKEVARGNATPNAIPPLPPQRPLELMAEEIELLAPPPVGHAASMLVDAISDLSGFDENKPEEAAEMREAARYGEVSSQYTLWRNRFIAAAKADLGTD